MNFGAISTSAMRVLPMGSADGGTFTQDLIDLAGVIAHACGVTEARQLRRHPALPINGHGIPEPLESLYPDLRPHKEYLIATNNEGATR